LAAQSAIIYCGCDNNADFSFFSRCFFTSFDVAIEQRTTVDTTPSAPCYPRKAFPSKAPTAIVNNCAPRNTLLRKSECQRGGHRPYTLPVRKQARSMYRAFSRRSHRLSQRKRDVSLKPGFPKPILFSELQR
jgi:hypothetical protein